MPGHYKRKVKRKKKGRIIRLKEGKPVVEKGKETADLEAQVRNLTSRKVKAPQPQSLAESDSQTGSEIDEGQESGGRFLPLADIPVGSLEESTMVAEERKRKRKIKKKKRK